MDAALQESIGKEMVRPEDSLELRPVVSETLRRLGYDQTTDNSALGITAGGSKLSTWVQDKQTSETPHVYTLIIILSYHTPDDRG
jgi:hypothetical protein